MTRPWLGTSRCTMHRRKFMLNCDVKRSEIKWSSRNGRTRSRLGRWRKSIEKSSWISELRTLLTRWSRQGEWEKRTNARHSIVKYRRSLVRLQGKTSLRKRLSSLKKRLRIERKESKTWNRRRQNSLKRLRQHRHYSYRSSTSLRKWCTSNRLELGHVFINHLKEPA